MGQRLTMSDSSGVTIYSDDIRNRLTSKQTPQGTISYSYDNISNLLTTRSWAIISHHSVKRWSAFIDASLSIKEARKAGGRRARWSRNFNANDKQYPDARVGIAVKTGLAFVP
jgi:YD repeat-containing protein